MWNVASMQNFIETIEGLDFLMNLKVLVLSHNRISVLEGVSHLSRLWMFDVSHNRIESFPEDIIASLPSGLRVFNLQENPGDTEETRGLILTRFQELEVINEVNVGGDGEEEEEEEEKDGISTEDADAGHQGSISFSDVTRRMDEKEMALEQEFENINLSIRTRRKDLIKRIHNEDSHQ
jgi:Leucine-rich repeat (LRR) protein